MLGCFKRHTCWLNANAFGNPTPLFSMSNRIYGTLKFEGNKSFVKREKKRGLKFETCQDDPSPMRQTRLSGSQARQIAKLYIYQWKTISHKAEVAGREEEDVEMFYASRTFANMCACQLFFSFHSSWHRQCVTSHPF